MKNPNNNSNLTNSENNKVEEPKPIYEYKDLTLELCKGQDEGYGLILDM